MKINKSGLTALACGFGLLTAANVSAQLSTNVLSLTTFEPDAAPTWGYGYFYGNNGLGLQEYNRACYLAEDVDLTNAMWSYSFDLTDLAGTTGYGTGTGGPLFLSTPDFVSGERADYIVTFDARVEGLDSEQANAEMQIQFYMPGETAVQKILQVNLPFNPTGEWQTFSRTLDNGSLGDNTSDSVFATNHTSASELRFNVNFHEPHNQFAYDGGNVLYIDNFKVEVVDRPSVVPIEKFPVTMAEWNFDDKTATSEYHYDWSQNTARMTVTAGNNVNASDPNTLGVNDSSGWFITLDNSAFAFDPPQWAGAGTGGSGSIDFSLLDSANLEDYRVTFDARVQGLAADRTSSSAVLQIHMDTPDDTFQPADEDANADFVIRLDFPIAQVKPEWQTYTFLFSKAGVGGGNKALFTEHHAAITDLRTQWQIENATSLADWDYDTDNTLVIDNVRLERLYAQPTGPRLNLARNGGQIVLTWSAPSGSNIKLQSATSVNGPYTDIPAATSGHTADTTAATRFFRLLQQ